MPATHFKLHVKDKGRTVLPVALRAACGFDTGATLIARQVGPGRAVVETEAAVLDRLWSRNVDHDVDGVEALKEMRAADIELVESRAHESADGDENSGARAAAMLAALGLD